MSRSSDTIGVKAGSLVLSHARASTTGPMQIHIDVGQKLPAHATAMGRVLLAGLSDDELARWLAEAPLTPLREITLTDPEALHAEILRTRERGFGKVDGEIAAGIRVIAVPVRSRTGRTVAALNLTAQSAFERGDDDATQYLPELQKAAAEIGLIWTYLHP